MNDARESMGRADAAGGNRAPADARDRHRVPVRPALALDRALHVDEAVRRLQHGVDPEDDVSQLYYVYVVNAGGRLVGVLSMRDLILASADATLDRVMRREVVAARADADDEHDFARLMHRHRLPAMPVVDRDGRLIGVVTAGDVLAAIEAHDTESVQRMVGAGPEERLTSPWHFSFRKRLPWLLVSLLLASAGASVVRLFDGAIAAWAILAAFMPVVAGMGGNASAQAMAVAIRGIATGDARRLPLRRVLTRELRIGVTSGVVTGLAGGLIAGAAAGMSQGGHGVLLGGVVALALLVNLVVACVWGACVPFVMMRLGFDPAQSATIFTTTLTDLIGFAALLGLATVVLRYVVS